MATRQAGFATVLCVSQGFANDLLTASFAVAVPPVTFSLPSPIDVNGSPVEIAGKLKALPPTVTFDTRADNMIGVQLRFTGDLSLSSAIAAPTDVAVAMGCSFLVGLLVVPQGDRFLIGLDLTSATVTDVDLSVIEGGMVSVYGNALHAPGVLSAITMAARSLPPRLTQLTPNGIPATTHIAPKAMPCGASLFDLPPLFDAAITVNRIVPRPIDGALVVGVDLAGTHGDPAALMNLFKQPGPVVYVQTSTRQGPVAFESRKSSGPYRSSVGVSVNPDAISSLIATILAPAAHNSFLDCHVALDNFGISFGKFQPPLQSIWVDGATIHIGVNYWSAPGRDAQSRLVPGGASVHVDVSATLGMYLQTYDGTTDFLSRVREVWRFRVYDIDVDLPWWVTPGLVLIGGALPFVPMPAILAVAGSVLPSVVSNLESQLDRRAAGGINGAVREIGVSSARDTVHLAGLAEPLWDMVLNTVSFTDQGLEAFVDYTPQARPTPARDASLKVIVAGQTVRDGGGAWWPVRNSASIRCSVQLLPGVADLDDPNLHVRWQLTRDDNGATVVYSDRVYRSGAALQMSIDHASPDLSAVAGFDANVTVYQQLHGRERTLGACHFRVSISDRFNRQHPYVRWDHTVLIPRGFERRISAIHRTAIPGRCEMADRATSKVVFEYLDALPFPLDQLIANRAVVCDYCFFGGPDKNVPLI